MRTGCTITDPRKQKTRLPIPIYDRLLVRPADFDQFTAGGIALPDNHIQKLQKGEVLLAGDGWPLVDGGLRKMKIKVGDTILYEKRVGIEFEHEGETYRLVREPEVLAIL